MPVVTTDWSTPYAELISGVIKACPDHLVGALLIPGPYGLQEPRKNYPEYWHWPEFQAGHPAGLLAILEDPSYATAPYGFHHQLWCGVFAPPDQPYNITFFCVQLHGPSLRAVLQTMQLTSARLYPSAFDLYELFEDINLVNHHRQKQADGGWLSRIEVNHDLPALERVFQRLLLLDAREMFVRHLRGLQGESS